MRSFFAALRSRGFQRSSAILFAELSLLQLRFLSSAGQATGVPGKNHKERRSNLFDYAQGKSCAITKNEEETLAQQGRIGLKKLTEASADRRSRLIEAAASGGRKRRAEKRSKS